jgi:tetratricopeptide (TPR) repeat protein
MELFDDKFILFEQGQTNEIPEEPMLDFTKSLAIYQRIIDEFPYSEMIDDAIYNKGFLFEEMEKYDKSNQVYLYLIEAYPQSRYIPEAYMRLGEYYFNPPLNDLTRAIGYYENVLKFRNSARYNEALYKIGWSHYRLSLYPEAISYFTMLVENSKLSEQPGSANILDRTYLSEEALEYIAICFLDFGGVNSLLKYLTKIGNPPWGMDVLEHLGDIYMNEKEEYRNAINVYESLLNFLDLSIKSPEIEKKIVDCYKAMDNTEEAFLARQKLFMKYNRQGIWWEKIQDEKAKIIAHRLTELAIRENINEIIKQAENRSDILFFNKAVELGNIYLNTFPEELNAYMIRWNIAIILDTKLHKYKEALQEYLTISLAYNNEQFASFARNKGLATIKDAAENAIVVADNLVNQDKKLYPEEEIVKDITQDIMISTEKKEPIPFSEGEKWLSIAYENYIKLFPFDNKTASILANAGALYYTHHQFEEALRYYKTLIKYFPQNEKIKNVQYSILESYFGKQDFQSTEILAKKILEEDFPVEIQKSAKKRLGEAIFLKAENFAKQGKSASAAAEFYRLVMDAPNIEFADRALFNAGQEYDRIKDYSLANRAYELLRSSYGGSSLLPDALNNLAFNCGELDEYQKGAERYEELALILKEEDKSKDALYNAFAFYERAKNWRKATEIGEKYSLRYPDSDDASTIYYKSGKYSFKISDFKTMMRIFTDFQFRFPDSPLGIDAYFELGLYYNTIHLFSKAENAFYNAYLKNESIKEQGLGENNFIASEGLYFANRILYKQFAQIVFSLPQDSLQKAILRKQDILNNLIDRYTKIVSFQTMRLPESLYRIGECYEDFANTWANQEIPSMDLTSKTVKEKEINERTTQIYSQALLAYQKSVELLEKLLQTGNLIIGKKDSVTTIQVDSLNITIQEWLERSKEKISEILYQMAEVNTQSVTQILEAPIPEDLYDIARLDYRNQILIKAVKPLIEVVIEAHRRNLFVADSLSLINRWIFASKSKILSTSCLLGQKYEELAFDALKEYRNLYLNYLKESSGENVEDLEELVNNTINIIEMTRSYSKAAVLFSKEGIQRAYDVGLDVVNILQYREAIVQFAHTIADSLDKFISISLKDQKMAQGLFEKEAELRFEEMLAFFEDNVYFLKENYKQVLEEAYRTERDFEDSSILGFRLGLRLIKMEPDTYADSLDISVESLIVPTDSTWLYVPQYQDGWEKLEFKMDKWINPKREVKSDTGFNEQGVEKIYGFSPTLEEVNFYFRKKIVITGIPIFVDLQLQTDSDYHLFINGNMLVGKSDQEQFDMVSFLQPGDNLFALEYIGGKEFSIEGLAVIRYIPENVIPKEGY